MACPWRDLANVDDVYYMLEGILGFGSALV